MAHKIQMNNEHFATTRWSLVATASSNDPANIKSARVALATLCETYWYPLYAYVRRHGCDTHMAQDVVQGYFEQLLEKSFLKDVHQDRGSFRSFLLASIKHHLANERRKGRTIKRGGDSKMLNLDFEEGERRYKVEPLDEMSPERIFERRWALTLLDEVMTRLRSHYEDKGRTAMFESLKTYLTTDRKRIPYADVAKSLNITESAAMVAVHRLRRRYRTLLRAEIAETITEQEDVDEEITRLFAALA